MRTTTSLSHPMPKEDLGSKSSVIQTLCIHVLYKLLLIMLQLANTDLDSSLGRNLNIPTVHILLKQDVIFVKIEDCRLSFSLSFIFFFFFFSVYFPIFLFLEQLGLGLICHAVTTVTWEQSHKTDHETQENLVEDSRADDIIQHGHHMLTSWTTHGCLG